MLLGYGAPRLATAAGGKPYPAQDRTAVYRLVYRLTLPVMAGLDK